MRHRPRGSRPRRDQATLPEGVHRFAPVPAHDATTEQVTTLGVTVGAPGPNRTRRGLACFQPARRRRAMAAPASIMPISATPPLTGPPGTVAQLAFAVPSAWPWQVLPVQLPEA